LSRISFFCHPIFLSARLLFLCACFRVLDASCTAGRFRYTGGHEQPTTPTAASARRDHANHAADLPLPHDHHVGRQSVHSRRQRRHLDHAGPRRQRHPAAGRYGSRASRRHRHRRASPLVGIPLPPGDLPDAAGPRRHRSRPQRCARRVQHHRQRTRHAAVSQGTQRVRAAGICTLRAAGQPGPGRQHRGDLCPGSALRGAGKPRRGGRGRGAAGGFRTV